MSMKPMILVEVFKYGEVGDKFFDNHLFSINIDKNRYQWTLHLDAGNLKNTKVLCYPIVIEKKKAAIISCMHTHDTKR